MGEEEQLREKAREAQELVSIHHNVIDNRPPRLKPISIMQLNKPAWLLSTLLLLRLP